MFTIGVLAIQGAVSEHLDCIRKVGCLGKEIKYTIDFEGLDGIILPGGESTTMAIVGESNGLFEKLKIWVEAGKPIWGTCAGMILLSNHAIKKASCGQSLIGGLDVQVCRNFFGSQIQSCEVPIDVESKFAEVLKNDINPKGIFIRAPAILKVGEGIEIIATVNSKPHLTAVQEVSNCLGLDLDVDKLRLDTNSIPNLRIIVAVQKANILATAFHPELGNDDRWIRYFLNIIHHYKVSTAINYIT